MAKEISDTLQKHGCGPEAEKKDSEQVWKECQARQREAEMIELGRGIAVAGGMSRKTED